MSEAVQDRQLYAVSICEPKDSPETLVFTFAPRGPVPLAGHPTRRVPQYVVWVRGSGDHLVFDWSGSPDAPGDAQLELQREAEQRLNTRNAWIARVSDLVGRVEEWGRQLGWTTRRIEKRLDDSGIGKHQVPALLMQEDTCRILLEPVGRSAPGAEGIADLYLMPAYDDIAGLYYYDNRWNLHYLFAGYPSGASVREAKGEPLSKEILQRVLEEMKEHAT